MPTASVVAPAPASATHDAATDSVDIRAHRARVPMWALALRIVVGVLLIALGVLFTAQRGDGMPADPGSPAANPAAASPSR